MNIKTFTVREIELISWEDLCTIYSSIYRYSAFQEGVGHQKYANIDIKNVTSWRREAFMVSNLASFDDLQLSRDPQNNGKSST